MCECAKSTNKILEKRKTAMRESKLSLHKAKELYPVWFESRVVQKNPKGSWCVNRAVYDWWFRKIKRERTEGHRYFCIYCLAIYAKKCSLYDEKKNPNPVTYDELRKDAYTKTEIKNATGLSYPTIRKYYIAPKKQ